MTAAEKKKKNRFKMRMIKFSFFMLCVIVLVLIAVLFRFLWMHFFHKDEGINTNISVVDMSDIGNDEYGKIYYEPISDEHVADENDLKFVDNEILIVVKDGTSRDQVVELSKKYNVEIVGEIEITGDYQLRISDSASKVELEELIARINDESIIDSAMLNYITEISDSKQTEQRDGFYFGKKWQSDLQNFNNAKGKSWGIEAIEVLAAWDRLTGASDKVKPVKVGVVDNGFDVNHEDLGFAEVFYDNGSNGLYAPQNGHGTHVCGTIAAKNNDTTGICGVYPYGDGRLYGVSHGGNTKNGGVNAYSENGNYWSSVMSMKIAYSELIVRNVKVINQSQGFNYYTFDYFKKKNFLGWDSVDYGALRTWWEDTTNFSSDIETAKVLADFLNRMLQKGYDFVIVSAAGNDSDKSIGHLDCRYSSWLNMIRFEDYPDVYNRIIVVGSVNKKMQISDFSNGGDRVDIYAPGEDIYSTWTNNKYKNDTGTSMAAPHVAGVAAMVWSANNSLTGAEVKESITRRWSDRCTSCHMVDAFMAVEHALGEEDDGTDTNAENGGVLCYVVDGIDESKKIQNASVILTNVESGDIFTTVTDELGHFEIMLPEGKYSLKVTASGYEDYIWPDENNYQNPIIVKNEGINYLDDWIKMKMIAKETVKLSVFALESKTLNPITNKEISLKIDNSEVVCSNSKQMINSKDGSVIFDIHMGEKNRLIDSKVTLHIDGYKDFVLDSYRFGNNPADILEFDAIFEKEQENTTTTENEETSNSGDISTDEDEFFEYLEDDYEDYDYGVPLEDVIAWQYYNGHLYALYDYAVSAKLMNLITLADPSVHLVTITDKNEQSAVEELIAMGGRDIYYTGGLVDANGNLYWVNGEKAGFTNWYNTLPESYDEGYDDVVVIYRGEESPADLDEDFGVWLEVLEDEYNYLDFFDFDLDGVTRGIIIEWDNPSAYGLN